MPARLRPVASEILRRIIEFLCVAAGKILKFYPCAQAAGAMHQNGRLGSQFGRYETSIDKIGGTKLVA